MRRTLLPEGRFLLFWELVLAVRAFLLGMIYPTLFVYMSIFGAWRVHLTLIPLDLIGILDL